MSQQSQRPKQTANPYRHCQCKNVVIDMMILALQQSGTVSPNDPIITAINLMRSKVAPQCPGTAVPHPDWAAMQRSLVAIMQKIGREELEDVKIYGDLGDDGPETNLYEALGETRYPERIAQVMVGGTKKLWEVLAQGKAPAGSVVTKLH